MSVKVIDSVPYHGESPICQWPGPLIEIVWWWQVEGWCAAYPNPLWTHKYPISGKTPQPANSCGLSGALTPRPACNPNESPHSLDEILLAFNWNIWCVMGWQFIHSIIATLSTPDPGKKFPGYRPSTPQAPLTVPPRYHTKLPLTCGATTRRNHFYWLWETKRRIPLIFLTLSLVIMWIYYTQMRLNLWLNACVYMRASVRVRPWVSRGAWRIVNGFNCFMLIRHSGTCEKETLADYQPCGRTFWSKCRLVALEFWK